MMHAKELTLLGTTTTLVGGFGRIRLERVVGAIMELSEQVLKKPVNCTRLVNKLTRTSSKRGGPGTLNLKRGGP